MLITSPDLSDSFRISVFLYLKYCVLLPTPWSTLNAPDVGRGHPRKTSLFSESSRVLPAGGSSGTLQVLVGG